MATRKPTTAERDTTIALLQQRLAELQNTTTIRNNQRLMTCLDALHEAMAAYEDAWDDFSRAWYRFTKEMRKQEHG